MNGKLLRLFGQVARKAQHAHERTGTMGKLRADGTWQFYPEDGDKPGFVMVTIGQGNNRTFIEALNIGARLIGNLAVIVEANEYGVMTVRENSLEAGQYLGAAASAIGVYVSPHSHEIGGGNPDPVSGRRIQEGLIHVTIPTASMSIEIERFAYWNDGTYRVNPKTTFDLTDNLPSTTGAWAWAAVVFNPATAETEAVTGPDYFTVAALDEVLIEEIDVSGRLILGAVRLNEADTAISTDDRFASDPDLRNFLGSAPMPGMDRAVVGSDGNVVTMNGEIVWGA